MILQFCGLSGSGKSTIAGMAGSLLRERGIPVEIIDGDEYRKELCADLGFSMHDRHTNIRRLAFVASKLSAHNIVAMICAINPYELIRQEVKAKYPNVYTVYLDCSLDVLVTRDTKGLYKRAMLPEGHPQKLHNLTGVNDPFDVPPSPDLVIHSGIEGPDVSASRLLEFLEDHYKSA